MNESAEKFKVSGAEISLSDNRKVFVGRCADVPGVRFFQFTSTDGTQTSLCLSSEASFAMKELLALQDQKENSSVSGFNIEWQLVDPAKLETVETVPSQLAALAPQ